MACSTPVENVQCEEKCERRLDCGHPCKLKCYCQCSQRFCTVKVEKKQVNCDHLVKIECNLEPTECMRKVKKTLPCGHKATVCCSASVTTVTCKTPCATTLLCGHMCSGTCSKCSEGRLHIKCSNKCDRILICSHVCKEPCTKDCPPCREKCKNRCRHSRCRNKCGDQCTPCRMPCEWKCKHKECTQLCFYPCNREVCDEPCEKMLRCGHPCIGLCGEDCPPLCRVCNKEKVQEIFFGDEDEPEARFIYLHDCQHIIEVKAMDKWMATSTDGENEVKLKDCPKCKTVIQVSFRYGNAIKNQWNDIEKIKIKILASDKYDVVYIKTKLQEKMDAIFKMGAFSSAALREVRSTLQSKVSRCKRIYQLHELENKIQLISLLNFTTNHTDMSREMEKLRHVIMKRFINDEQQYSDVLGEIERLKVMDSIKKAQDKYQVSIGAYEGTVVAGDKAKLEEMLAKIQSGKKIEQIDDFTADLRSIEKRLNIQATFIKQERAMIVQAMGFKKGHWYKCPNGHFYAIGECGGANQRSKCPECKADIGGSNHQLVDDNRHASEFDGSSHAAWSDAANNMNNFQLNDLR